MARNPRVRVVHVREKDADLLIEFYDNMLRIRFFEEKTRDVMMPQRQFRGSPHLAIGQEAVAANGNGALALGVPVAPGQLTPRQTRAVLPIRLPEKGPGD